MPTFMMRAATEADLSKLVTIRQPEALQDPGGAAAQDDGGGGAQSRRRGPDPARHGLWRGRAGLGR